MRTGPCRGCGAPMIWTITIHGKKQPVNTEPSRDGNLVLLKRGAGDGDAPLSLSVAQLSDEAREVLHERGVACYLPHHATCPARKQFQGPAEPDDDPPPIAA